MGACTSFSPLSPKIASVMPTSAVEAAGSLLDHTDVAVPGFCGSLRKVVGPSKDRLGRPECRADPRSGRASSHQAKVLGPAPAQNTPALGPQVPSCASVRTSQWPGTRSISTSPSLYREGNGRRSYSSENLKGWGDSSHCFYPTREGDKKKTFVKTCVSC